MSVLRHFLKLFMLTNTEAILVFTEINNSIYLRYITSKVHMQLFYLNNINYVQEMYDFQFYYY